MSITVSVKRQPIIITEEEKKEIDEKYPESYENHKIWNNPRKKNFTYVSQVLEFQRDGLDERRRRYPTHVIPEGAEVDLDDGKYIYKVTDKYTTPGFIQSKKNKHGYFLPCCFGLKDGTKQAEIIKK